MKVNLVSECQENCSPKSEHVCITSTFINLQYWGWISLTKLAKLQVELWYYAGDLSSLQAVASSMHLTLSDNITGSGAAQYVADTMCILNDSWVFLAAYNFLAFSEVMTALAIPVNSLWQNYYFRSYTMWIRWPNNDLLLNMEKLQSNKSFRQWLFS